MKYRANQSQLLHLKKRSSTEILRLYSLIPGVRHRLHRAIWRWYCLQRRRMGPGGGICATASSQKCISQAQEAQVQATDDQVLFAGLSRGYHPESRNDAGIWDTFGRSLCPPFANVVSLGRPRIYRGQDSQRSKMEEKAHPHANTQSASTRVLHKSRNHL